MKKQSISLNNEKSSQPLSSWMIASFLIDSNLKIILKGKQVSRKHSMLTKSTRIGLWLYSKFDMILDYLVMRWGWTWLEQPEDAWRKKYPYVTKKIDELEKRINKLEKGD